MEGDLQKRFAANFRAYRLSLNLSQEAMGLLVDCHRTYIGAIERHERNLTLRSVERLAALINLSPLAMLGLDPFNFAGVLRAARDAGVVPGSSSSGEELGWPRADDEDPAKPD